MNAGIKEPANRVISKYRIVIIAIIAAISGAVSANTSSLPVSEMVEESGIIEPHTMTKDEQRAVKLLNHAIENVKENGPEGVNDFSQKAEFTDRELYVFALRVDGRFLASGGSSSVLVGDTVLDTTDMFGKPFFREMIEKAVDDGGGMVEYHWTNPTDSQGEPKRTMFKRVGDIIVAVGYYPSRATSFQARKFLDDAIKAMVTNEGEALKAFNQPDGGFVKNDLYVFVLDMKKGTFIAHGSTPSLIGLSHNEVLSPDGKAVITKMLKQAKEEGKGELTYLWENPTTGKAEAKHTYYRVLDNKLVGVGYYQR